MAKKKTSKKVTKKKTTKKTSKKKAATSSKKVTKKQPTKQDPVNEVEEKEEYLDTRDDIEDDDDEEIIPISLEGENLKNEIEELESADNGKKNLSTIKKTTKGGTRRVKQKHTVVARQPSGGLKFAPGVMINRNKATNSSEDSPKENKQQEFRRLTSAELKETRQKLIELRERILENMRKELADYRHRSSSNSADPIDQAADAYDDNVTFEIAANNDEELEQIESALEKIEKGTYGLCEMCSVAISPTRLKILPFATRCVNCRQSYEKTKVKKDTSSWAFPNGEDTEGDA